MQYRAPANRQEVDTYREMVRLAFNVPPDEMEYWQTVNPLTTENSRCLFDDEGRILCGMEILDGGALYFRTPEPVPTALISAVASPPEHRRKGYIRRMFEGMFTEQRDSGIPLTALYPFYFPFYRSFGYELAHDAAHHTVKIEQFKGWRKAAERGRFVPVDIAQIRGEGAERPGGEMEKLNSVYTPWAQENLGAVARNTRGWWLGKLSHKMKDAPAYLYYAPDGKLAGYIIYHLEDKPDWKRDMVIHDMRGIDPAAEEAIYGFIYNHDSQAQQVIFWGPVDAAFPNRMPDPREDEVKVHAGYMLRLLNVEGGFEGRRFVPEAEGEFTFALTDEMLPANNGSYRVQVRDGRARVERLSGESAKNAGVHLDARMLAQLYGGYASPTPAARLGQIKVTAEGDLRGMEAVLHPPGQPIPYMADDF